MTLPPEVKQLGQQKINKNKQTKHTQKLTLSKVEEKLRSIEISREKETEKKKKKKIHG